MNRLAQIISLYKNSGYGMILIKFCELFKIVTPLFPYPLLLMIEPTNACNLSCPTCPFSSEKMNRPLRMMSFGEFKGIIDQVKGRTKIICLWNNGEPFLNKELFRMIEYASSAGMYVITSTNGESFESREFCFRIVQSGLKHLIISLEGADHETNNRFRKNSHFNRVIQGITYIQEAKKALNSKVPILELQFLLMKHNEHKRNDMKQLAAQLHVDIYCEKTLFLNYNDGEFQNKAGEFLPEDQRLRRYVRTQDGAFTLKGKVPNCCSRVYFSTIINSDGTVVPCCWDLHSDYAMGNVFEESLKVIWKSAKYQAFRKQIERSRTSVPICNICPEGRYVTRKQSILKR